MLGGGWRVVGWFGVIWGDLEVVGSRWIKGGLVVDWAMGYNIHPTF